ncbi:MAG: hypothetical protein ACI4M3_06080 [Acutalibacteraceae bacterium]
MKLLKVSSVFLTLSVLSLIIACILFFESNTQQAIAHIFFFISEKDCTPAFFGTLSAILCLPAFILIYQSYSDAYHTAQRKLQDSHLSQEIEK